MFAIVGLRLSLLQAVVSVCVCHVHQYLRDVTSHRCHCGRTLYRAVPVVGLTPSASDSCLPACSRHLFC